MTLEHLAVRTDRDLEEICATLERELGCDPFELGAENENQWGEAKRGRVTFNVSRPYEAGKLREWDASVPEGFEVGISIDGADSIAAIARSIANALGARVVHHRTWGKNDTRHDVYDPSP